MKPNTDTSMKRVIFLIFGICALAACSIKEDRHDCPSEFVVVFNGPAEIAGKSLDFNALCESSVVCSDRFTYSGGWHERTYFIPRKEQYLIGTHGFPFDGEYYTVTYGKQCDSLYSGCTVTMPDSETGKDTVILHKNFATVNLSMKFEGKEKVNPYDVAVRANYCGIDLRSDTPIEGKFRCWPADFIGPEGFNYHFRLPRLSFEDGEFELGFCERESGEEVYTMKFDSDAMYALGYSWRKPNLDDIYIDLTVGETRIDITIGDWFHSEPIDISF